MLPLCILTIENDDDREFMADLFVNYQRLMHSTIKHVVVSGVDAEDVMQTTLVKLIDKISVLRELPPSKRINYIISACKNTAFNANRNYARHLPSSLDDFNSISTPDTVADNLLHEADLSSLRKVWEMLDKKSRFLLRAKYILELDDKEIAQAIGVSPQSVRTYISRARKTAHKLMES